MPSSAGKVKPFVVINRTADLYGTSGYPVGGVDPPFSPTVSGPAPPNTTSLGPLPGTNCIDILRLRDYYKLPAPPISPLASPPVIGVVSFGGGIYGGPVSSGKYAGFWRCTDISGATNQPINILVAPINGAINAPNADDGGATLENTVDVATVNAFYGNIVQGINTPTPTPPVIILYIAPSDDVSEVYNTFYTVLKNPVVCNGQSYLPSIVCCSWGAPEVSWTQMDPFPTYGENANTDPNPSGIAEMNEINDLFADAVKRGINICVASGDIALPANGPPNQQSQSSIASPTIMFPASSPYVTCVGGSSVFFPNGPTQNYNNPGEFAWVRADGGVSTAFPIPEYQLNLPGAALISADQFLKSSQQTADLLFASLGEANVGGTDSYGNTITDISGNPLANIRGDSAGNVILAGCINASLVAKTKLAALTNAQNAYNSALSAYNNALAAGGSSDASSLQLQLALNAANTALSAASANNSLAQAALVDAQNAVILSMDLKKLLTDAGIAYNIALTQIARDNATSVNDTEALTLADEVARDASLFVANSAIALSATSVIAPTIKSDMSSMISSLSTDASGLLNSIVIPYDSFPTTPAQPILGLTGAYTGSSTSYPAYSALQSLLNDTELAKSLVNMTRSDGYPYPTGYESLSLNLLDSSGYSLSIRGSTLLDASGVMAAAYSPNTSGNLRLNMLSSATAAARLAKTVDDNVQVMTAAKTAWVAANQASMDASGNLGYTINRINPSATPAELATAYSNWTAANKALTLATVALANAEYATLHAANFAKALTSRLFINIDSSGLVYDSSGYLLADQIDASGADVHMGAVQKDVGNYILTDLVSPSNMAIVAQNDAAEALLYYNKWMRDVSGNMGVSSYVTDADTFLSVAYRVVSSMKALSALYDNNQLQTAIPSVWAGTPLDISGNNCISLALNNAISVVTATQSYLLSRPDASGGISLQSVVNAAYGSMSTLGTVAYAVNTVGLAVAQALPNPSAISTAQGYASSILSDSAIAKASVLDTEGAVLYLINTYYYGISQADADAVAGFSSYYALYDEFFAMNIAADNANHAVNVALNSANLSNASVMSGLLSSTLLNQRLLKSQSLTYKAVTAVNNLISLLSLYGSVTPSLVDCAIRSNNSILIAAQSSNLATATQNPGPVTPQLVEQLQTYVLTARNAAELYLENDPTNVTNQNILSLWNAAVSAGAAALADMPIETNSANLVALFTAFKTAITNAWNATNATSGGANVIPVTSNAWITANIANNLNTGYFSLGLNGANLTYLMLAANTAASAAWNATSAANTNNPNSHRTLAMNDWNTAKEDMDQIVNLPGGLASTTLTKPYTLNTEICSAFTKVTGITIPGNINATISGTTLTVTSIGSAALSSSVDPTTQPFLTCLDVGTTVTFRDSSNNSHTVTITGFGTGLGGTGTYTTTSNSFANASTSMSTLSAVNGVSGISTTAKSYLFLSTDASGNVASDTDPTSAAFITALSALKAWKLAFDSYNVNFLTVIENAASTAASNKAAANVAIQLALASAARLQVVAKKAALDSSAMATSTAAYQDIAAYGAIEGAYATANNVNMYRCIPDIAMHADADDLPVIFKLNGGKVYVGGTSIAAAMFAGFLAAVQSHTPTNFFVNPVLYNNFTYPSPLFHDISGTNEIANSSLVTSRYSWIVATNLDSQNTSPIHGSYNTRVGLGSIRGNGLSAFLETPQYIEGITSGPYPYDESFSLNPPFSSSSSNVITVYPGTTQDVYAYVVGMNPYNPNVTWSCSSPYNATVSQTIETIQLGRTSMSMDASGNDLVVTVFHAVVTGVVPTLYSTSPTVITVSSTDGSNLFTTITVNVSSPVQVTGVSISSYGETKNPSNTVLYLGNSLQLIATVTPIQATNKNVYWWSSNTSIVNVDSNGLITPLSPGQATIRVTTINNNISASINVYVPTPMTGVSVLPSVVTLNPDLLVYPLKNTQLIKASVTPTNVDYKYLRWHIVSSQPLALPAGTTDQAGNTLLYRGNNNPAMVPVISIHDSYDVSGNLLTTPGGIVLKRDSNGNVIDNTNDIVTGLSNGRAVIRVSTDGVPDTVYGTYMADIIVNVVTPVTNITIAQTNMTISLNPSVKVPGSSVGSFSKFSAVNPSVNIQYGVNGYNGIVDPNMTLPWINAATPDRNLPQSYNVTATLFPAFPTNTNLIWSSSNPKVAIVSNNSPPVLNTTGSDPNLGLLQITERITPLSNGSAVIKVTTADGNKIATVNVTVTTPVSGILLSPMPVTLSPGSQYALQATVTPANATNIGLVWSSTNSAVATVDQSGVVRAVSSGSCGISVSTQEGDYTAMATINVVTSLIGVSLVVGVSAIHVGDRVPITVVMTPTTATDQSFTWTLSNYGMSGAIFTNGPPQDGNVVYIDAAQVGSATFTVTTHDGNKQASVLLTVLSS